MTDAPGINASAADLYRALHRPAPLVLIANSPHRFAGLAATVLRPRAEGSAMFAAASLLALAAVSVLIPPAGLSSFLPPAVNLAYLALAITFIAGLRTAGQRSPALWVRLAPTLLAIVVAAAAGGVVAGWTGAGWALAALLAASALGVVTRFLIGDLAGRLLLRWRGHPVPLLGGRPQNEMLAERWRSALADPEAERDRHRSRPPPQPGELAAARRAQALIERLPLVPFARGLDPVLGRGVEGWRQRGFERAYRLADPGHLVAAALALDREATAVTLLEGVAVVLVDAGGGGERDASSAVAVTAEELGLGRGWRALLALAGPGPRLRVLAFLLDREPDAAMRWACVERLGPGEIVRALGRAPVDEGPQGRLYRLGPEARPTMLVRVLDLVPGPGGAPLDHWLPVPPHVATAREAVAWTFGAGERGYSPAVEA